MVSKCVKYQKYTPFKWFTDEVSERRRESDKDPSKKIEGDREKLLGNSFYGKMIENKERHTNIAYTLDERRNR